MSHLHSDHAAAIPAGWYEDPHGTGGQRWWDGVTWTTHVAPAPSAVGTVHVAPQIAHAGDGRRRPPLALVAAAVALCLALAGGGAWIAFGSDGGSSRSSGSNDSPAAAPKERLDHDGYQRELDSWRVRGAEIEKEITSRQSEIDGAQEAAGIVAELFEPLVQDLKAVRPPLDVEAAHTRYARSVEDYIAYMRKLEKDPATASLNSTEFTEKISGAPEVREMWLAHADIEAAGYRGDSRDAPTS